MIVKAIISKNATEIEKDILSFIKKGLVSEEMIFSGDIFFFISGYYTDEIVLFEDVMTAINRVRDFILKKCKH